MQFGVTDISYNAFLLRVVTSSSFIETRGVHRKTDAARTNVDVVELRNVNGGNRRRL